MPFRIFVLLALATSALASSAFPQTSFAQPTKDLNDSNDPNQKALNIAKEAKQPERIREALIGMVKKMVPSKQGWITRKLLDDTLSLLGAKGYPEFVFRVAQNRDEPKLIQGLLEALPEERNGQKSYVAAEWAAPTNLEIFPRWQPMPLLAAPGSAWSGHHVYPGGLVYHLFSTAQTNLKLLETYEKTYAHTFTESEKQLVVLSGIWHDAAKTFTMTWKQDGTLTAREGKIAWAGSHHVISAAEALYRGHAKEFVKAIAASHDPANENDESFQKVLSYFVATAILAGKPFEDVGITKKEDKFTLETQPSIFMTIQFLGDGDWVLTGQALVSIRKTLNQKLPEWKMVGSSDEPGRNWLVNRLLSAHGEVIPYHLWQQYGESALLKFVQSVLRNGSPSH